MERRLLTFIVASTAFFLFYAMLVQTFAPPPPKDEAKKLVPAAADVVVDEPNQPDVEEKDKEDAKDDDKNEGEADDEPAATRPENSEWLTLGSADPTSEHLMLVTLNSRGAGVERIELTERDAKGGYKYRRVDVRHGYLGYLAAADNDTSDGVRVNVIGPGTPAEIAGIQVGDILVTVGGKPVTRTADLTLALLKTKPNEGVSVELERAGTTVTRQAQLTHHPLDVVRLARDGGADQVQGNLSRLSCLMTLSQVNRKGILTNEQSITGLEDPAESIWTIGKSAADAASDFAEFTLDFSAAEMKRVGGKPVRLKRSYSLAPKSYVVDMSLQVDNTSQEDQDLAYRLEGPNGITMEGWWYSNKISPNFSGAAARDIVSKNTADGHALISGYSLLKKARKEKDNPLESIFAPDGESDSRNMQYIAVDAQYFTVGYIPPVGTGSLTTFRRAAAGVAADPEAVPRHQERAVNSTFYLDSVIATVPPGASMRQELRLFAGPKRPELLAQYSLDDCIYYGWFARFAKILAAILHFFSGIGNYAIAIVLLTVLVRGLMFPLSRKAALNAQKMQELAPEMKKINENFKDDMEGKLKAQRALQQRVGFNPLAGCLPMFLQLPIFIGLYRALSVDIELRQAAVGQGMEWASNLAAPDMLKDWSGWMIDYVAGRGTGWLGPYFNILPIFVVILFLAQQKLFMPPATDEQTAMTQKMMNIMTLMMGLFFFRVPAGLCIYFITSSLWGICERLLVKKTLPKTKHFDSALIDGSEVEAETKSSSIADRIRSKIAKPEEEFERPNKRKRPKKKK